MDIQLKVESDDSGRSEYVSIDGHDVLVSFTPFYAIRDGLSVNTVSVGKALVNVLKVYEKERNEHEI